MWQLFTLLGCIFLHTMRCLLLLLAATLAAADRPNILFIVADDLGYADVGFHGCKDIPTPHLDALAAAGVRCTNGYVTGPYCSPTRAGLLTGRQQNRFGHEFNPNGANGLPLTEGILPERLGKAGYVTGMVGKWHLGSQPTQTPPSRGFAEFFGFLGGAHSYFNAGGFLRGDQPVKEMDYATDAFGREAEAFVRKHADRPWFLYLPFNAVHTPMDATDARLAKFASIPDKKRRTYAAMLSAMDDNIGRVRQALKESGQEGRTLICFISDNGGPTMNGTTTNGSVNAPFRGSKRTTLEGGIRVPFLVAWPGRLAPAVYDAPVVQLDLHATALAAAGVAPLPEWKLEGADLLPYFAGTVKTAPHEALYWRFGEQMAIRQGDWKLVRYDGNADTDNGKRQPVSAVKLYDLSKDIHEDKDLAAEQPEKVKQLQARWDEWNRGNMKPLWGSDYSDRDGPEPGAAKKKKSGK